MLDAQDSCFNWTQRWVAGTTKADQFTAYSIFLSREF
jgi:hypothetical protein